MKNLALILFLVCSIVTTAHANEPYTDSGDPHGDGYDDAISGQGDWSENLEYQDGYEDGQIQKEIQDRIERERQEREAQQRDRQEEIRNRNNQNW